ncbi:transcription factor IIIB 90 kDa subunit [Zerene cesonia]|uniref:transcription factor IIIB 90 kDa subunit n=1 Tax=Zerene cesonia TaxID=33412 RepID=UPI0018E4EDBE|nr:transcription factor IIIB 90 kDa subunit [Zerene cesonia]
MSSGKKCKHCGSSEIEVDPARGDAVCTNCGSVLEDSIIVADIEFQETAHGGASVIGQFVSADSKGGASGFGRAYSSGIGQESREVTLRKARDGITALSQQLRLNPQCIDMACNFFKMALVRHLTIGRPAAHTQAACVYMTCRTEGTAHLLIDISDALQICCYQLGRTYFKLSRALCINIPPTDPCLYILRFASQLQFEDKQHEVSMTALRLVQRMKRDSIHSGRRPSGICGAALLIAARIHNFSRTPADVVRIVKVHESTLRKRLMEFGDTPSSALTLDEFMSVDLEEDQDPPAFRAARKRDKERLQKLLEEEDGEKELTELQKEIESQLEKDNMKRKRGPAPASASLLQSADKEERVCEDAEATRFAAEKTMSIIDELAKQSVSKESEEKELGPEIAVIGITPTEEKSDTFLKPEPKSQFNSNIHNCEELVMSERDEEYISSLIMSQEEARHKTKMWNMVNAGYLKEQKIKEEMRAREREEGKDKKKKVRGSYKKKVNCNAATAGEAIGKMLAEKKMSSKINYDILKSLDQPGVSIPVTSSTVTDSFKNLCTSIVTPVVMDSNDKPTKEPPADKVPSAPAPKKRKKKATPTLNTSAGEASSDSAPATPAPASDSAPATPAPNTPGQKEPEVEDYEDEMEADTNEADSELSLAAMLQTQQEDDYYDYEEY